MYLERRWTTKKKLPELRKVQNLNRWIGESWLPYLDQTFTTYIQKPQPLSYNILPLRPYLTAYTNVCFATGQLIGAGVLQTYLGRHDNWAWRIPFSIQWLWPPFLIIAAIFMPESPWWLVRKGRYSQAEKNVRSIMVKSEEPHARPLVAMMIHTNTIEKEMSKWK